MRWLVDTGVLLRMNAMRDPLYAPVRDALDALDRRDIARCCAPQNIAEFWRAATRPSEARGGFGLPLA